MRNPDRQITLAEWERSTAEAQACVNTLLADGLSFGEAINIMGNGQSPGTLGQGAHGAETADWTLRPSLFFQYQWATSGYQRIQMSHRLAASLMATKVTKQIMADLEHPWPAYIIELPDDVVNFPGLGKLLWINVATFADGALHIDLMFASRRICAMVAGLSELFSLDATDEKAEAFGTSNHEMLKASTLASRLIVGTLITLEDRFACSTRTITPNGKRHQRRGSPLPTTTITTIRRPVTVDCRPAIKDYVESAGSTRGPVTVQTLVEGHWKMQVCGVGRLGRKYIHIESYWRGPEDAPIVVRPHRLVTE